MEQLNTWDCIKLGFALWPFVALAVGLAAAQLMRAGKGRTGNLDRELQAIEDYANAGGAR
jgi:hypothetical protein